MSDIEISPERPSPPIIVESDSPDQVVVEIGKGPQGPEGPAGPSGGGGTPGGSDTQVQFNDAGAFGGDAGFTFDSGTQELSLTGGTFEVAAIGVNASWSATDRISVSADSTLLSHHGSNHVLKVRKAGLANVANITFQSGTTTRAEIGLISSNSLTVRTSPDGSVFNTALTVDSAGVATVSLPLAYAGQASDPGSPVDGYFWYNSTTGKFRARQGGVSVDVIGGVTDGDKGDVVVSSSGTVWTLDGAIISAIAANTAKVSNATHTGDATGSTALTLATVNSNVGSFGSASSVATFTVNAKGLTTAAGSTSIQIAESQVTGLVSDLAAKAPLASPTFTGTVTLPAGQIVNGVTLTTAGGTTNFLRADGTYAAPSGGGGSSLSPILSWMI